MSFKMAMSCFSDLMCKRDIMIKENLLSIREEIKDFKDVTIVIATKYVDENGIKELYECGERNFGENRCDAFLKKYEANKDLDIVWHFIGHLQTNKVKDIVNKVEYIHSLDSLKLAKEINKEANKKVKCFIEVHNGIDDSKYGFTFSELNECLDELKHLENIEIVGLMVMAPNTTDKLQIRSVFNKTKYLQEEIKRIIPTCVELSMGMSNDYLIALDCGASFLRLGRVVFEGGL